MAKVRYPLVQAFMSRDGSIGAKDAFVQNGYMEDYNNKKYVCKRPGVAGANVIHSGGPMQGAFYFAGFYYTVQSDVLNRSSGSLNAGTDATQFTLANTAPWAGRISFGSVVFNNRIFVIAGLGNVFDLADVNSTADGLNWVVNSSAAPFGTRRGHQVVVFQGKMFLIGGATNNGATLMNDVWMTEDGDTWTQLINSAPWSARNYHCCVVGNNGIFLYAGTDASGNKNDVWFSPDGVSWTQLRSTPAPWAARFSATGLFFKGLLWIIGGQAATTFQDVWSSPDGVNWTNTTGSAFGTGRSAMAGVVYNNKMWVFGGTFNTTSVDQIDFSSPDGVTWTVVPASPGYGSRASAAAVVFSTIPTYQSSGYSQFQFATIWVFGGTSNIPTRTVPSDVHYGNINTPINASYTLSPAQSGLAYDFATFNNGTQVLVKNASNLWVLNAGTIIPVTDPNYPKFTARGLVVLNSIAYVMTPLAEIHGSSEANATTWPALEYITADYEDDPGVAIAKYSNYLVAFGSYTTQFYYDAGNPPPGISLSEYLGANQRIGCVNGGTIQNIDNTLMFLGQTEDMGWGVYMLNGFTPQRISPTWVDNILDPYVHSLDDPNATGNIIAYTMSIAGHSYYVIPITDSNFAIVYDNNKKQWMPWSVASGAWPFVYALANLDNQSTVVITGNNNGLIFFSGSLYQVDTSFFDDAGTPFTLKVQTDKLDGDVLDKKFWGNIDFVGDTSGSTINVSYSDDDYQTFSTPRALTLTTQRPRLSRWGSSRRRSYVFTQTDSKAARWEAAEIAFEAGEG